MLGGAFVAGWKVADLLDLTWPQIALVVECSALYRAEQIRMVADPLQSALTGSKAKKRPKTRPDRSKLSPEERDALQLASLGSLGFPVSTKGG